jgi:hypothetical protein
MSDNHISEHTAVGLEIKRVLDAFAVAGTAKVIAEETLLNKMAILEKLQATSQAASQKEINIASGSVILANETLDAAALQVSIVHGQMCDLRKSALDYLNNTEYSGPQNENQFISELDRIIFTASLLMRRDDSLSPSDLTFYDIIGES